MSLKSLETEILIEARLVTGKKSLRKRDIMEWSTGDIKVEDGEKYYFLPVLKINIAVKKRK